ncbi:hypothetical protein Dimus_008406 [Dionaea muscipula]
MNHVPVLLCIVVVVVILVFVAVLVLVLLVVAVVSVGYFCGSTTATAQGGTKRVKELEPSPGVKYSLVALILECIKRRAALATQMLWKLEPALGVVMGTTRLNLVEGMPAFWVDKWCTGPRP